MQGIYVALYLSLKVAFWATFFNLFLGIGFAYVLSKKGGRAKVLIDAILTLPMVLPPTVIGYYLLVVFGSQGYVGQFLQQYFHFSFVFTWQGAVLAATVVSFPLVFKPAFTAFETLHPDYERAGKTLGLGAWARFCLLVLPLCWPAIVSGALLGFARSLGEFGATLMIAGSIEGKTQTLSIAIWEAVQAGQDDVAQLLVWLISVVSLSILLGVNFLHCQQKERLGE